MAFESVRGYVQLASGLGELTKARATEAAQSLLSLPAAGIATGSKVAGQAGALAEEMLAVATTNHSSLTALVRSEVDVAATRLGLVPAERLEESQVEAARLRAEVARLRSASSKDETPKSSSKKAASPGRSARTAPRRTANGASVTNVAATPTAVTRPARTAAKATTARGSAVTTRAKPAGT